MSSRCVKDVVELTFLSAWGSLDTVDMHRAPKVWKISQEEAKEEDMDCDILQHQIQIVDISCTMDNV